MRAAPAVEARFGGELHQVLVASEDGLLVGEVRPVEQPDQLVLAALFLGEVQQPVHVEGVPVVTALGAVAQPLGSGVGGDVVLGLLCLLRGEPVLLAEHLDHGGGVALRAARVELEGTVHHLDLVPVREGGQRLLEPRLAHVAPGAGDVAPDLDAHVLHLSRIVTRGRPRAPGQRGGVPAHSPALPAAGTVSSIVM